MLNLTKGMDEEQITKHLKNAVLKNPQYNIVELTSTLLPNALSLELCKLACVDINATLSKQSGKSRAKLIQLLTWTPLTINGYDGFKMARITRGGISLKEINPKTMQSKLVKGLYFCDEVMNIDGPCGGYNLR